MLDYHANRKKKESAMERKRDCYTCMCQYKFIKQISTYNVNTKKGKKSTTIWRIPLSL